MEAASVDEYYEYIPSTNKIYAMQNTKALSLAYGVSNKVLDLNDFLEEPKYYSSLELQNKLINAMLSGVMATPNVLRGIYANPLAEEGSTLRSFTNVHTVEDENGEEVTINNRYYVVEADDKEGSAVFNFEAAQDGDIYMHLPGCNFREGASMYKIYVNDVKLNPGTTTSDYFTSDTWTVVNIGNFENGEKVTVRIEFSGGKLFISSESPYYFYYIDYSRLNTAFDRLLDASMYIEEYGNDYVKGSIDLPEGQELIFTTSPYDKGWKVYIDGEKAETVMALDSLLAVPSTAGYHDIEFVYRPDCAVYGGILSVIGILAFAALVIWSRMRRVRVLAKCDDDKTTHFFHYAGDAEDGWMKEAMEACDDAPAKEITEASSEEESEACEDKSEE